jgi:serine/threonine-protein kinase
VVVLDRFELKRPIGFGGTASVWLGVEEGTGREVAIKVQNPGENVGAQRFERLEREGLLLQRIDSPYVMKCLGFGRLPDGRALLVFEYLRGQSLREVLESRETLPLGEALDLLSQLLRALAASHDLGIIHRDLKPDNIMVLDEPDCGVRVKLFDFGIAKLVGDGSGLLRGEPDSEIAELLLPLTAAEMTVGTPEYMAPEQISATDLGPFTDVYAVGVVLYEMLFGEVPYTGKSFFEIAHRHLAGLLPPLAADLPEDLHGLIWRALACDQDARYATVDEMLLDVMKVQTSPEVRCYDDLQIGPADLEALFNPAPTPFADAASMEVLHEAPAPPSCDDGLAPWATPAPAPSAPTPERAPMAAAPSVPTLAPAVVTAQEWLNDISLSAQQVALSALDQLGVGPTDEVLHPFATILTPGVRVSGTGLRNSVRIHREVNSPGNDTQDLTAADREKVENDLRVTPPRSLVIRRTDGQASPFQRTQRVSGACWPSP